MDSERASSIARVRESYEQIADDFSTKRRAVWPEVKEFSRNLEGTRKILDAGCGNGRDAAYLMSQGHEVVGLDFSRRLLRLAQARNVKCVLAELTRLPFRTSSFDAALCNATLHHLPSEDLREKCLMEVHRCLAPFSPFLVGVWSWEDVHESIDVMLPWKLRDGRQVQRFYHLFVEEELCGLLLHAGFEVEKITRSGDKSLRRFSHPSLGLIDLRGLYAWCRRP